LIGNLVSRYRSNKAGDDDHDKQTTSNKGGQFCNGQSIVNLEAFKVIEHFPHEEEKAADMEKEFCQAVWDALLNTKKLKLAMLAK